MTSKLFRPVANVAAGALLLTLGFAAAAAESDFRSPLGVTLETPGAMQASEAILRLRQATAAYVGISKSGSAAETKLAREKATEALKLYEAALPGAKRDTSALLAALNKANKLSTLDRNFYAQPAAFLATAGEVAAVKAAGGPVAVLSNSAKFYDQDLVDFRSQLGLGKAAWHVDLSPIPTAHAGLACSLAAWSGKMTCLGYKPCYNWWARANNNHCL